MIFDIHGRLLRHLTRLCKDKVDAIFSSRQLSKPEEVYLADVFGTVINTCSLYTPPRS